MKVIDKIIELINKENAFDRELTEKEKELLIDIYSLTADPLDIDDRLIGLFDEYLKDRQNNDTTGFDVALKCKEDVDPLIINADMLVVFSNNLMVNREDLLNDAYSSIDNCLVCRAGLLFKAGLYRLLEQDRFVFSYNKPYIVDGYNLPAKRVAKLLIDNRCEREECIEKLYANVDNLIMSIQTMNAKNIVVLLNTLPALLKKDKKIIKHIKNTLKSCKSKIIFM